MVDVGSVTQLMHDGGEEAFWNLYVRFVLDNEKLQNIVRNRLPSDRVAEPVDILSDAFHKVWKKAIDGEHKEFSDRNNLLALLTVYAKASADDARKRKRAIGDSSVVGDSDGVNILESGPLTLPSDQALRAACEEIEDRIRLLSDEHQKIAILAMQGKSQQEIMRELQLPNLKRVERAFEAIRQSWTKEYTDSFLQQWQAGQTPGFDRWYLQFVHGGRWLLKSLCEIEIHERLKRGLPVSLTAFQARVHVDNHGYVSDVFHQQLFFDENPSDQLVELLRSELESWFVDVVDLKLAGHTNEQIASSKKCPRKSVGDAMLHLRARLVHIKEHQ